MRFLLTTLVNSVTLMMHVCPHEPSGHAGCSGVLRRARRTLLIVLLAGMGLALGSASPIRAQDMQDPSTGSTSYCDYRETDLPPGMSPVRPGGIFCPLLADPKDMHSFGSYVAGQSPGDFDTSIGAIGIADGYGLFRSGLFQISVTAGVLGQFDLSAESLDLINTDFVIGLPVTFRYRDFSGRVRIYHQSSHLGDEYLLRDDPVERENLSFESIEVLLSQSMSLVRVYGGGEFIFNKSPEDLGSWIAHGGLELRPAFPLFTFGEIRTARFVAGVDVKAVNVDVAGGEDWDAGISVRGGINVTRVRANGATGRGVALLVEFYDGPTPYGQFFREDLQYVGFGLHFFP